MKLALSMAAAMAAVLSSLFVLPVAAVDAASPSASVQWPEVARFNPATYTYDAVVTKTGTKRLFAAFVGDRGYDSTDIEEVPESGHLTPSWTENTVGVIRIWACTGDYDYWYDSCTAIASSPRLTVYTQLSVSVRSEPYGNMMKPGRNVAEVTFSPGEPEIARPSATWELLDLDEHPLARPVTGGIPSASVVPGSDGWADLPIVIPAEVPGGDYLLDVHMSVEDPVLGHLEGGLVTEGGGYPLLVHLDTVAPRVAVKGLPSVFYPALDGYRDSVTIHPSYSEGGSLVFEVFNSAGVRVHRFGSGYLGVGLSWDGRGTDHRLAAQGTYTLKVTLTDEAGNSGSWTGRIVVSRLKLKLVTWKRTVTAAPYMTGKFVGRCSTLKRRAHGALGLYSQKKCRGGDRASTVIAQFGMYIPKAVENSYGWGQLTVDGSPATSSDKNYLIAAFVKPNGKLGGRRQLGKGNRHVGATGEITSAVYDRTTNRPYLIWSTGLTAGSRYDVRRFTIRIGYRALR